VSSDARGGQTIRTFGTGLLIQGLLSGANFLVGLILIRRTNDLQYGYYVLATNALLLLTALQTSFIQPYIVSSITKLERPARAHAVGALIRNSSRWLPICCGIALAVVVIVTSLTSHEWATGALICSGILAGGAALNRELLRTTLFAYHQPARVARADFLYVLILLTGALLATQYPSAALIVVSGVAVAHFFAGWVLRGSLWRFEPWDAATTERILGKLAAAGAWAILGSGIHWLLIQGYSYLTAAVLSVADVAAIAATRLTLMPVFVLSGGVSMLLFPVTARWIHQLGTRAACRRLMAMVAALSAGAVVYMLAMWLARDWIFSVVLKKSFADRDFLLLLWCAVFLVTLCRDQLATLPAARSRFRDMSLMTAASAVVWLCTSYIAMHHFGPAGAVMGMLAGEFLNVCGIVALIVQETRPEPAVTAH
jgi:O-antigen/teichoic acid export membrane protein